MISNNLLSFLSSQDEYHCFLEKILLRAESFYSSAEPSIKTPLINNYIEMEKFCLKEDYRVAAFYYMKQLEEFTVFGLSSLGDRKISGDLRTKLGENEWILSPLGEKMLVYYVDKKNPNENLIKNLEEGRVISFSYLPWTVKHNLFKYYFECKSLIRDLDEVLYYKRNQHGHAKPVVKEDKEISFNDLFPNCFDLIKKTRNQLQKYSNAITLPQNR